MLFLLVWQHLLTSKAAAGHRRPFAFCFCSSLLLQSSLLSLVHFCLAYTILVLFRATCILRCCILSTLGLTGPPSALRRLRICMEMAHQQLPALTTTMWVKLLTMLMILSSRSNKFSWHYCQLPFSAWCMTAHQSGIPGSLPVAQAWCISNQQ